MLEVSSRVRKKKNKVFNKYTLLGLLCVLLLGTYPYVKSTATEFNDKNDALKKQIQSLTTENDELKKTNDTLTKSKTEIETKINSLPKATN